MPCRSLLVVAGADWLDAVNAAGQFGVHDPDRVPVSRVGDPAYRLASLGVMAVEAEQLEVRWVIRMAVDMVDFYAWPAA